jgi:CBS domain-containing protein
MEMVAAFFGALLLFAVLTSLLVMANATWRDEEPPYHFGLAQPHTKSYVSFDRESSTAKTPETSPRRRELRPEQIIEAEPTVIRTIVGNVMGLPQYYCFQGQDLRIARIMMRENHLQRLPVVDVYMRIVGTITMGDIATFEAKRRKLVPVHVLRIEAS